MQMNIEVPDDLPKYIIVQQIKDLQEKLMKESERLKANENDPWSNPDIDYDIPQPKNTVLQQIAARAKDLGVPDLAEQHDHYLYGTNKL